MVLVKLNELPVGTNAILGDFADTPLHLHLLTMGISPGMQVTLVRRFPMQGNLYLRIGSRAFVIRDKEAQQIVVSSS